MALQVRLSRQVDAILVTEVIPTGIVRIVTGTYRIDVQILHYLDILNHPLHRDDVTTVRIEFMTVGTFYQYRLAVDQQLAVLDLNMTETDALRDNLQHLVALLQGHNKSI